MPELTVELARSVAELRPFEGRWNELVTRQGVPHPMSGYAWVVSLLEHLVESPDSWFCVLVFAGDDLVGVLPIVERAGRAQGRAVPSGSDILSVGLVADPDVERSVIRAALGRLSEGSGAWAGPLRFPRQRSESARALSENAVAFLVSQDVAGTGAFLNVPSDFGAYRASLSKNFRRNLNRGQRSLAALPGVSFSSQSGADATPGELDRFGVVEASGWKGREGTAIVSSSGRLAFYRAATRRLSRAGWLEWHFLNAKGATIAGLLAMRCGRALLLWKIAFDERFARCSPGNLLIEETIRRRVESQDVDTIDMLTDYSWHSNWRAATRDYFDLTLYDRRSVTARLRYVLHRGRTVVARGPVGRLKRRITGLWE